MGRTENKINRFLNTFNVEIKRASSCPNLRTLLRQFVVRFEIDCVLDVGANVGGYGKFLRQSVGYRGLIISFEPVRAVHDQLRQRAECDPRWETHELALGAENRTQSIHVTKDTSFSSFLPPQHKVVSQFEGENKTVAEETVTVKRLDSLFEELRARHGFRRPYLKMDTQGYDLDVLRGAGGTLEQIVGVQSEISLLPIYENMPGLSEAYDFISRLGFDLVGMYPVNKDAVGRWIEADCAFLNRRFV